MGGGRILRRRQRIRDIRVFSYVNLIHFPKKEFSFQHSVCYMRGIHASSVSCLRDEKSDVAIFIGVSDRVTTLCAAAIGKRPRSSPAAAVRVRPEPPAAAALGLSGCVSCRFFESMLARARPLNTHGARPPDRPWPPY